MSFPYLDRLIENIAEEHRIVSEKWKSSDDYIGINLSKKLVVDVMDPKRKHPEYMEYIFKHRSFLNEELTLYSLELNNKCCETRVKTQNSTESKLFKYMNGREGKSNLHGEMSLNKCLNDLYGLRYIFKENVYTLDEVIEHVKTVFPDLKVINSSKDGYKGVHVYFKENNYTFPWELQIWNSADAQGNKISHSKYKQEYTKWESQSEQEVEESV